jgi:hypothetical protein
MDSHSHILSLSGIFQKPTLRPSANQSSFSRLLSHLQDSRTLTRRARERFARPQTRVGNHSMRATGITDYLKSDGSLI